MSVTSLSSFVLALLAMGLMVACAPLNAPLGTPVEAVERPEVLPNHASPLPVEGERSEAALDQSGPAFVVPVGDSPALGPRSAWVTVVEFVDFECSYCARAHATMAQLMKRFPGRIRWVIKNQPLGFHEHAVPAAIVLTELYERQGAERYWQAMEELYSAAPLTMEKLRALAAHFGLAAQTLDEALALGREHPRLVADQDLAEDLHARGTPHFFINGRRLEGARPLPEFVARVEAELYRVEQVLGQQPDSNHEVYALLQAQAQPPPGMPRLTPPSVSEQSPVLGPKRAPVTIQMFADFECGYCGRVMPTLKKLLERHEPEVRLVWRHLPLSFHANARIAAQAAMEARAQQGDAGFWAMANSFFEGESRAAEAQTTESPWSAARLRERARQLGLDVERFDAALADGRHVEAIEQDAQLAAELGLRGTPVFFINDRLLMGAQPERRFERVVGLALRDAETK